MDIVIGSLIVLACFGFSYLLACVFIFVTDLCTFYTRAKNFGYWKLIPQEEILIDLNGIVRYHTNRRKSRLSEYEDNFYFKELRFLPERYEMFSEKLPKIIKMRGFDYQRVAIEDECWVLFKYEVL